MLTKEEFLRALGSDAWLLDGATGSWLRKKGMPQGCVTEEWILHNPEVLIELQRGYASSGSRIVYAPTFQAQPIALERIGLQNHCEAINAQLVALSRAAAPDCLIAGDITTLAAFCETWDPDNYDEMVENYRRQIRGLLEGGADLLVGETLLYPQEASAILEAAQLENAGATMITFTMQGSGHLFSGQDAGPVMKQLEGLGAAAVGFNCVAADENTPCLVSKLRRFTRLPLICKPNAGNPVVNELGQTEYTLAPQPFAEIQMACRENGARLLGGCCGTEASHIAALRDSLTSQEAGHEA